MRPSLLRLSETGSSVAAKGRTPSETFPTPMLGHRATDAAVSPLRRVRRDVTKPLALISLLPFAKSRIGALPYWPLPVGRAAENGGVAWKYDIVYAINGVVNLINGSVDYDEVGHRSARG